MQQLLLMLFTFLGLNHLRGVETNILDEVSVSTLDGVSFFNIPWDIKMGMDGEFLYVLDNNALWKVNPITKTKELVAGAASSGYVEGVGNAARFNSPRGISIMRNNKAVISDEGNSCLREVDLISHQTTHLAGICQSSGFLDGIADQAKFFNPAGVLADNCGVLVADHNNNAVRFVKEGMVSTIVSGSLVIRPTYLADVDGQVFVTTNTGILRLDPDSLSVELIVGHESSRGFSDGALLSARFSDIRGLVSPAPGLIIIADYANHRMRLVDLENNQVSSICTGVRGSVDGSGDVCQLDYPWSVETLEETVYIGQSDGTIRTIPIQSFTESCPPSTVDATLPSGQQVAVVEISSASLSLPVGHFVFVSQLSDRTLCSTNINVIE